MKHGLDYLRMLWTQRVVEYNILDQFEMVASASDNAHHFAARLGSLPSRGVARALAGGAGLALALAGAWLLRRRRTTRLPRARREAGRLWRRIEARLAREGFNRRPGETARE